MDTRNIYAIFKKEISGYLYNPTTYIIAGVFIAVWEFLFFQNVFLVGQASVQNLFALLPWFFLLFIPAITMGSIAEETSTETLEILLTHPIRDRELIFGKYLSALAFSAILLLASLPIAFSLRSFGDLDLGVYVGQYIAGLLLASALVSLGVGVSTYFKNQVPALMVSVMGTFLLIIMGYELVTMSLPAWIGSILSNLSVLPHFNSIARGVLDVRDIWYFALFTILFLELGHMKLIARRTSQHSKKVLKERTLIFIILGVLVATSGFSFFPSFRFDLTEGKIYTLSKSTKDILSNLPSDVEIILYKSESLPAQYQPLSRTVKDVLKDYGSYGGSKLRVTYKNPETDETVAKEAQENGVNPVQFNMVGNGEFKAQQAYFGIAVKSGEEKKTIPIIQNTSDIEYQLTSFISELTKTEKKKIAFLDMGGKTSVKGYTLLTKEMKKQFSIKDVVLSTSTPTIPEDISTLVISRPTGALDTLYENALRSYLASGKNALFLMDGLEINAQYMVALPNSSTTDTLLGEYGVSVHQDMVYDLRSNQTVQVGGGNISYFLPYPAYIRAFVTQGVFTGSRLTNVTIPWGSSLSVEKSPLEAKQLQSIPLIQTSKFGGVQTENYVLDPQGAFSQSNLGEKLLGVLLKPVEETEGVVSSRIIVIGDSDFLTDDYVQGVPENIAFGMEILSYLAQEDSLAGIKIKQEASHPLSFTDPKQTTWVRYGNMLGTLAVLVGTGVFLISRRRKMRTMTYKEGKNL
jgi:ABC-2 type transport system permease protein